MNNLGVLVICCVFAPLLSGAVVGFFVRSAAVAQRICNSTMLLTFIFASAIAYQYVVHDVDVLSVPLLQWSQLAALPCTIGLRVDGLTVVMLLMITFVSMLIHFYSVGYMRDDVGYVRFFSLISLFTFSMLFLVATDNLIGLFFGWECISLFSYFLIGFYYFKDSAARANIKAFLINRFGDCAFCLGIALLAYYVGSTSYYEIFKNIKILTESQLLLFGSQVPIVALVGILFFIGAMSKSAQIPLHIWLPDSMEGPTPVSALLHAATMVTAGVYLLVRFGVLIEQTHYLQNMIAFIGATGALFLGLQALCEMDIKRIIAYSTLSQLGYMVLAVGVGAYQLAIFHLIMHAFFKACLFMAAGSIILALNHEQDVRKMGSLWQSMPITGLCFLLSALALSGVPPFAGFYSKDLLISAVAYQSHHLFFGTYIYSAALLGFLITPLYIFRLYWVVFTGASHHKQEIVCESPRAITVPMFVLALLSVIAGFVFTDFFVGDARLSFVNHNSDRLFSSQLDSHISYLVDHGIYSHAFQEPGVYLSIGGIFLSWLLFRRCPQILSSLYPYMRIPIYILENKYGFDWFNDQIIVPFFLRLSEACRYLGEQFLINRTVEHRVSLSIQVLSEKMSRAQTSLLNRYFAIMVLSIMILTGLSLFRYLFLSGIL